MAINRDFNNMLNEFVGEKLLLNEVKKRNFLLSNIEMTTDWLGGAYIIPFVESVGSSVNFGAFTDASDIASEITVRASVPDYKIMTGSMALKERDLMEHGQVNVQNFYKIIPDSIARHADYLSQVASQNLLVGKAIAPLSANGGATGEATVTSPERFLVGQKVVVDDDNSSPVTGYIKTINKNTGVMILVTTRGGSTTIDLSAYTTAQNAVIYNENQQADGFTSLREILLPATAGGSANFYSLASKLDNTYTQAIAVDGASVTSSNILQKIFDAYVTIRKRGQGKPFKVVMSYRNYGYCLQALETAKGAFNVIPNSQKTVVYGWDQILVGGFAGTLTLNAVVEMNDSEIMFLDMDSMKFATNKGLKRVKSPDGLEYFTIRATSGYTYILDHQLYGELVVLSPCKNGILYNIP